MKRIIRVVLILVICLSIKNVYAEDYKINELIPPKVKTSIHTDNFSYKKFSFDEYGVNFGGIKNLTDKSLPVSISIGLFDKNGVNIGAINHCEVMLESKQETAFFIDFNVKYLAENYTANDIKYISILSDNITCKTEGSTDFVGKKISKMVTHNTNKKIDNKVQLFLSVLAILAGAGLVFIVYKLIFTKSYRNIDGNEVRKAFAEINKELKEKREKENSEIEVLEEEPSKPIEILEQEEEAKTEDKNGTDLHNLYK
jgi:translation initiation factor IF-2